MQLEPMEAPRRSGTNPPPFFLVMMGVPVSRTVKVYLVSRNAQLVLRKGKLKERSVRGGNSLKGLKVLQNRHWNIG
jgi:hypothetical protein